MSSGACAAWRRLMPGSEVNPAMETAGSDEAKVQQDPGHKGAECSELTGQRRGRLLPGDDRYDFKLHQAGPLRYPSLKKADVAALHQLKAAAEVRRHPAIQKGQALGHHASLLRQAPVNGLPILVPEPLDHHKQHVKLPSQSCVAAQHPHHGPHQEDHTRARSSQPSDFTGRNIAKGTSKFCIFVLDNCLEVSILIAPGDKK